MVGSALFGHGYWATAFGQLLYVLDNVCPSLDMLVREAGELSEESRLVLVDYDEAGGEALGYEVLIEALTDERRGSACYHRHAHVLYVVFTLLLCVVAVVASIVELVEHIHGVLGTLL